MRAGATAFAATRPPHARLMHGRRFYRNHPTSVLLIATEQSGRRRGLTAGFVIRAGLPLRSAAPQAADVRGTEVACRGETRSIRVSADFC